MHRRLRPAASCAALTALLSSCSATPDAASPDQAPAHGQHGAGPAGHAGAHGGHAGRHGGHAGHDGGNPGHHGGHAGRHGGHAGRHGGNAGHDGGNPGRHGGHAGRHGGNAGHHGGHGGHAHGGGPLVHRFERADDWVPAFEGPERDAWQKPAEVIAAMRLAPGMRVADLGAGTGYFLPHLSRAVGPTGAVIGLDIERDMGRYMTERAARERLANVTARTVSPDDPGLDPGSVDRILVVNTWHHIPDRPAYAAKLKAALRPDGAVVVVDFTDAARHGPEGAPHRRRGGRTPRRGRTHRVMSPMEFMARLAALIPPPKIPLVRYHGVFAPRSSWRSLVTPKPPSRSAKSEPCAGHAPLPAAPASPAPASPCAPPALSARSLAHAEPTVRVEPTLISVLHWGRLLDGELFATSRYVEWAVLMKRTFGFDALRCPRCERRMRVLRPSRGCGHGDRSPVFLCRVEAP
ncbi:methyltransferase domain-containing protein [Sorangium sp. So ce128]|uniref:class I SAM-dependent methyltransferase n=1 Tax=Sorangium sp. So ce128 TaxID=3133281 RepID=UPI003F6003D8